MILLLLPILLFLLFYLKRELATIPKAKKIIIIDHHLSGKQATKNKILWRKTIENLIANDPNSKLVLNKDNYINWTEAFRSSASEMVAELDKEITDELKAAKNKNINHNWMSHYIPGHYKGYRISLAAGIVTDSGDNAVNTTDPIFTKQSKKQISNKSGQKICSTNYYYKWLLNNSGFESFNMFQIINQSLPYSLYKNLNKALKGDLKVNGIEAIKPSRENKVAYFHIEDPSIFDECIKNVNNIEYFPEFKKSDLISLLKRMALHLFLNEKSNVYIFSINNKEKGLKKLFIYSKDNMASKIVDNLTEKGLGKGGGHHNACGFCLKDSISLKMFYQK